MAFTVVFSTPNSSGQNLLTQFKHVDCPAEELEQTLLNEGILFRTVFVFEGQLTPVSVNYRFAQDA